MLHASCIHQPDSETNTHLEDSPKVFHEKIFFKTYLFGCSQLEELRTTI